MELAAAAPRLAGQRAALLLHAGGSPHYNLALEEALLRAADSGLLGYAVRVWVNPASVVVGRTLEPCREVRCREALRLGVPVLRRVSGGGAVYHDAGNVNLTIVVPARLSVEEVYRVGTAAVVRAVEALGAEARVENGNDVVVSGYKVSGSAAAVARRASLFHATLLVSADTEMLRRLIKPRLERVERGEVTPAKYNPENISRILNRPVSLGEAARALLEATGMELEDADEAPLGELAEKIYEKRYVRGGWSIAGAPKLEKPRRLEL